MPQRFSVSGARGRYGDGMDPRQALDLAAAFAQLLDDGPVILGRDTRWTSPVLRRSVIAALTGCGRRVIDIGVVTTPTTQLAVEWREAAGGVMLTASHNPVDWNGLKFIARGGTFLNDTNFRRLKAIFDEDDQRWATHDEVGIRLRWDHAVERHLDATLRLIDVKRIAAEELLVAVDCCGGAGGVIIPRLLDRLGVRHLDLGCRTDGVFTRDPEPLAANLDELRKLTAESEAVLGLAYDSDVDRLALVGENGEPLGEERTLQLATLAVLEAHGEPGAKVACNLSTSRCLEDIVLRHGGELLRAPVGEINVVEAIRDNGCLIGGEGNGGVIYPALHLGRDAIIATALILEQLARSGRAPGEILAEYPAYTIIKEKRPVPDASALERAYAALRERYPTAETDERDGLRLAWEDSWLQLRPSGTEPVVRIFAEAPDKAAARELIAAANEALQ